MFIDLKYVVFVRTLIHISQYFNCSTAGTMFVLIHLFTSQSQLLTNNVR